MFEVALFKLKSKLKLPGVQRGLYVLAALAAIFLLHVVATSIFYANYDAPGDDQSLPAEHERGPPNLPSFYWNESAQAPPASLNATCAPFPPLSALEFHNLYWQTLRTSNGTLQLLSAYADARPLSGVKARILAVYDGLRPVLRLHCQFWYEGQAQPVLTDAATFLNLSLQREGIYNPYVITCPVPEAEALPQSVALVERPCDQATNNLRLVYQRPGGARKNVAVCVKALDLPGRHAAARLVEWLELLRLLGADKVIAYSHAPNPKTAKLLAFYVKQRFVEVAKVTIPAAEAVQRNDCFYRLLYEFRYAALLDPDEVVVPANGTWREMIVALEKNRLPRSVYYAEDAHFLESSARLADVPEYMRMLQHVMRSMSYTKPGGGVKGFFSTDSVLALRDSLPVTCLAEGGCSVGAIPPRVAQLQRYGCASAETSSPICRQLGKVAVEDRRLWNFKGALVERVKRVVDKLGLASDDV